MTIHGLRSGAYKGAALLALGAAVAAATGCGSDSGGSAAQSNGGGAGVVEAQTLAERATTRPTSIGLTKPIGKPVPAGKKVAYISCGVEACEIQGDIVKQGAAAVILNAVNRASVAKQIEQAKQEGVAFVTASSVEKTGDGILANIADTRNSGKIVVLLAPRPLASTLFRSTTLYVNI